MASAVTLNFEGFTYGTLLTNQYASAGVTFTSPDAQILQAPLNNYQYTLYPPHSGTNVLFSPSSGTIAGDVNGGGTNLSFFYTCGQGDVILNLYSGTNLVGSVTGGTNVGTNSLLSIAGVGFDRFEISGLPNFFSIDDLKVNSTPVPEPASIAAVSAGLLALRRRKRV